MKYNHIFMIVSQLIFMSYDKRASHIQFANRRSNIYTCSTKTAPSHVLFRLKTAKTRVTACQLLGIFSIFELLKFFGNT